MCEWSNGGIAVKHPGWLKTLRNGKEETAIDECIVPQIKALWDAGIPTLGCCCGHGKGECSVILPSAYDPEELYEAYKVLKENDSRRWSISKWTLVEVAAVPAKKGQVKTKEEG